MKKLGFLLLCTLHHLDKFEMKKTKKLKGVFCISVRKKCSLFHLAVFAFLFVFLIQRNEELSFAPNRPITCPVKLEIVALNLSAG